MLGEVFKIILMIIKSLNDLNKENKLTVRIAYNLFTQRPDHELEDFENWTKTTQYQQGNDYYRHNGAGEMLVFSAADFEDFLQPRPDLPKHGRTTWNLWYVISQEMLAISSAFYL